MNLSITEVSKSTTDERIKELTRQLFVNANRRVRVKFIKKNGELRTMEFVPRNQYNAVLGNESTAMGRSIVAAKVRYGMITVCEIVGGVELRPRTVNLATVVGDIELA